LLNGVVSQKLDSYGKLRILKYDSGLCLFVPPSPPLDLPIMKKVEDVSLRTALKFVKDLDLEIISQEIDHQGEPEYLKGIWIGKKDSENEELYIPIKKANILEKEEISIKPGPQVENEQSLRERLNYNMKVARYLKNYTLFEYSWRASEEPEFDSTDIFVVKKNHVYNLQLLGDKFVRNNDQMYSDGKLIVPTEEIVERLTFLISIEMEKNEEGLKNYKMKKRLPFSFMNISDFRQVDGQVIFTSTDSLKNWLKLKGLRSIQTRISFSIREDQIEPYFYMNNDIYNSEVVLLQNVVFQKIVKEKDESTNDFEERKRIHLDDNYRRALTVSKYWNSNIDSKANLGYYVEADPEIETYGSLEFSEMGLYRKRGGEETPKYPVMFYGDKYAAILRFI